jgi:tetratricopeptide (TPR) repeat protein
MNKIIILIGLIIHLTVTSYSQNLELDSIKKIVEDYKNEDTTRVHLLLSLTKYYTSGDISKSIPIINEALQISRKLDYKRGVGASLNALSQHYIVKGDLDQGLTNALKAKTILSELKDNKNLLITNSNLARIYTVIKKYDEALEIHLQNIEVVKDYKSSSFKAGFYFYAAKTYEQLKDYKKAESYYLTAKEISDEANFSTGISIARGSLGNLYNRIGEYDKAIEYISKTLEYSIKNNQISNMAASYYSLAKSYEGLGKYDLAINYNDKAIVIYEDLKNFGLLKSTYLDQSIFFEKVEKFDSSNKYLKSYYAVVDSIFSENKVKIIEELQTKYETEKKEAEITSLSQQTAIQTLEINQKNQAIIISLIVMLFLLSTFYFIYRQRAFKNQQSQTELEQRFLRSQLNPHFISNALMAVQNFMLKNEPEKASTYLAKFSKLMREILENSRQEFIPIEDEIQMLTNYLDIHRLRMNESFDYKIEIDESIDVEADTIPPMFVQPFIENAIEHGIINAKGQGIINLNLIKEGDYISIEIRDNGGGIVHNSSKSAEHNSLSTTIIQERMALFNKSLKKKIQLVWEDVRNENGEINGTKVELKVPFSYI